MNRIGGERIEEDKKLDILSKRLSLKVKYMFSFSVIGSHRVNSFGNSKATTETWSHVSAAQTV